MYSSSRNISQVVGCANFRFVVAMSSFSTSGTDVTTGFYCTGHRCLHHWGICISLYNPSHYQGGSKYKDIVITTLNITAVVENAKERGIQHFAEMRYDQGAGGIITLHSEIGLLMRPIVGILKMRK